MRLKARTWFVISLMCFGAGVWMWHYGEEVGARRRGVEGQGPKVPGSLINAVATNATGAVTSKSLRLSNTRESVTQLLHDDHAVLLRNAIIDTRHPFHPDIPSQLKSKGAPGSYIVQFDRPLNREFYDSIKKDGASYVSYIPNNAALVKADAQVANALESDPVFQAVLPYEPYYKLDNTLLASAVAQTPQTNVLSVTTFAGQGDAALKALTDLGAKMVGRDQGPFGPILVVSAPPDSVAAIAQLPLAQEVEAYAPRHMANDLTRVQLGITTDTLRATPDYLGLTGSNVMVNLNDTGVDGTHVDFSGPNGLRVTGAVNDPDGHGTHVAGIIIGNGDAQAATPVTAAGSVPNADFRGKATNATLFVQSVNEFFVSDAQLVSNASVTLGPSNVISANSWNYGTPEYDMHAASYDAATRDAQPYLTGQQPLLFVFAAGNVGGVFGSDADNGIDGQADSIWSPGTAKNVITVGATDSPRFITNEVSYDLTNTNQVFFGSTENSNLVAWFSSCGNVGVGIEGRYGRFKPDVVAPGVFIVSCRASNYIDPTNEEFVTVIPVTNQTVLPGKTNYYPIRIFSDTSEIIASVTPNADSPTPFPGLRILSDIFTPPTDIVATNFVVVTNLPPGISPLGTNWYFGVTTLSNQAQPVAYDLTLYDIETNSLGDYFQVLSNMNKALYPSYMYQSGTSMAAGAVAGTLALMQEFLERQTTNTPSPALLKALLINGSRSINLLYDFNPQTTGANEQGWGMPNITNCIPVSLTNPTPSMVFVEQSPNDALATGQSQTYTISATDSNSPVRITLVWTDPPGDPAAGIALVNNLALTVVDAATNVYVGNDFFSGDIFTEFNTGDGADLVNNVQNVYIDGTFTPIAFPLTVTISGLRVNVNAVPNETNQIAQDYALVISSDDTAATLTVSSNAIVNPLPPSALVTIASNGVPLLHQRVGANEPNAYNNLTGATNGNLQQWHFFVFTNYEVQTNGAFTNLVFLTFQPPNLAVPRASGQADLDMYVSTDPRLLKLNQSVINNSRKSLTQEGTEFVVVTNDTTDFVWYVGIKSEDQQAADFGFFAEVQTNPFASTDQNGNLVATGIVVPQPINDAATTATLPVFAIFPQPLPPGEGVRKVEVSLTVSHGNPADLYGTLIHSGIDVVLNHYTGPPGGFTNVYDDLDESATAGTQHSDGPGSLTQYIGETGAAAEGVWELLETDNAVAQNGQIALFTVTVSPQPLGLAGIAVTPPNSWTKYFINVPTDATNMIIVATNFSGAPENIGIFLTNYPDLELFDYGISNNGISSFPPLLGSLLTTNLNTNPPVPPATYPPLAGGVWYWGIYNFSSTATVTNDWGIIFQSSQTPNLVQSLTNNTPIPLETDGTTQSQLCISQGQQVLDLNVGVRINDTNLDDLVLHLTSPQGTSVLLFENRGGLNANTLGLGSDSSNMIYTVFTDDTNLTTTPVKFAPYFVYSNGVQTNIVISSNSFENVAAKTYTNGQLVGDWTVASNEVGVFNEGPIAHSGTNFLALTSGRITNTFTTVPGAAYELQYYARGPGITNWWPGDDNALDIVGTNNGVALGVTNDIGEVNRAFTFDGNGSVSFGTSTGNVGTNDFSIDFWVKSTYTGGLMALLEKRPVCSYEESFFGFRLNTGGVVTYEQSGDGVNFSVNMTSKKVVADGTFHQCASHVAQRNEYFSLCGWCFELGPGQSANGPTPGVTVISNNVDFYVGKAECYQNGDSTQEFIGDMDEIDLWNRALSPAEIEAIFKAGSEGKYNRHFAFYPNFEVSVDGYSTNTVIITNFAGPWQSYTNSFVPTNSLTTIELKAGNTLSATAV